MTLDELANFLNSDAAPGGCMDLSELDGFLAGLVAGPEEVPPQEWLAEVWDHQQPDFEGPEEEQAVLEAIFTHYATIEAAVDASPLAYAPILWQDESGTTVVDDWAVGFMQAVSLRSASWQPALADEDTSLLLIPIASLAEMGIPESERAEQALTDEALEGLLQDAEQILPVCVLGLRRFWHNRATGVGIVRH